MNAALIGSVSSSAAVLRGMLRGGLEVAGVCGLHARHAERVSDFCDLRPFAEAAGVPFVAFDKVVEAGVVEFLTQRRPDWLFVVGISQLVPAAVRELARVGAVGFHPTMLPEGRGRAPVAWTILLQKPAAANLFFLTDEADAGDIIAQRPVEVLPDDYAVDLIARTNVVLEQMVVDLAPVFASGNVPRMPQDHSRATYYARRRPEDGRIDWNQPAEDVYRLVRAAGRPYPGAFCFRGRRKVVIWRGGVLGGPAENTFTPPGPPLVRGGEACATPGIIVSVSGDGPVVATARGRLVLTDIEVEGEGLSESSDAEPGGWVIGERLT
jgi:methionyl-tRNA formyltransferase